MKKVFELSTPTGTYTVQYGEFMQGAAKGKLLKRIKADMAFRSEELVQKTLAIKLKAIFKKNGG